MRLGVLFDWDGVVINSAAQHERSWELLAQEENLTLPPGHFRKGFGMKNEMIIPNILEWTTDRDEIKRLSIRKEVLYREMLAQSDITPLPGVTAFMEMLHELEIPCAIGSSTQRLNIEMALDRLNLHGWFDAVVTGEDVLTGKPDPAVFLLASQLIDRPPHNCLVIEDAPAGIAAAHNGGMKAVGVTNTHPAYELTDADMVVRRLDEIGRSKFAALFCCENEPVA